MEIVTINIIQYPGIFGGSENGGRQVTIEFTGYVQRKTNGFGLPQFWRNTR